MQHGRSKVSKTQYRIHIERAGYLVVSSPMKTERSIGWLVKLALERFVTNAAVVYLG